MSKPPPVGRRRTFPNELERAARVTPLVDFDDVAPNDPIGQGERLDYRNVHHDAGYPLLLLGETVAGWMVWDSIRALDYLETRDDVDASDFPAWIWISAP